MIIGPIKLNPQIIEANIITTNANLLQNILNSITEDKFVQNLQYQLIEKNVKISLFEIRTYREQIKNSPIREVML